MAVSYAYQLDQAGSVIGLTSATGTVVASYSYDPWGNPTSIGGTNAALAARQPLRYRGYYWDAESALYYMPARFYDPAVGRFLSVDPAPPKAGSPVSLNAYAYCENDPVQHTDPSGAIMDVDGAGRITSENTAWHSYERAKDPKLKSKYLKRYTAAADARRAKEKIKYGEYRRTLCETKVTVKDQGWRSAIEGIVGLRVLPNGFGMPTMYTEYYAAEVQYRHTYSRNVSYDGRVLRQAEDYVISGSETYEVGVDETAIGPLQSPESERRQAAIALAVEQHNIVNHY